MAAVVYLGGVAYSVDTPPATADGTVVTVATPAPEPAEGPPLFVVIGDSYTSGGWAESVAARLELRFSNLAIGGSGYVRAYPGVPGSTFPSRVATALPADADVVVVFGGLNDRWTPELPTNVGEAARTTFAAIKRIAPGAVLIVAGPQHENGNPPPTTLANRDAVRAVALEFGAVWVDPLDERWFADPALIGPDGLHPNAAGQQVIADRLAPVVAAALGE